MEPKEVEYFHVRIALVGIRAFRSHAMVNLEHNNVFYYFNMNECRNYFSIYFHKVLQCI